MRGPSGQLGPRVFTQHILQAAAHSLTQCIPHTNKQDPWQQARPTTYVMGGGGSMTIEMLSYFAFSVKLTRSHSHTVKHHKVISADYTASCDAHVLRGWQAGGDCPSGSSVPVSLRYPAHD